MERFVGNVRAPLRNVELGPPYSCCRGLWSPKNENMTEDVLFGREAKLMQSRGEKAVSELSESRFIKHRFE